MLAMYNMVPNLVWSVLNLMPVFIYCLGLADHRILYIFLAVSLLPVFLKNAFLDKMQIGKTTSVYKRLMVHQVNKVAQNGVIINNLVKRKFSGYVCYKGGSGPDH
ncbi:hypothetical protein A8C56_08890 [Niabella ginsenosidivorans]|uniref:Uncharacterized protein n=1 Tax=Niabella ginsenosidivorans TaxID=1176587 RepID=A0A1A9I1Y9_9BACT|nr:hypothetical protein [Niabella ginsenosidivorans]ANH81079.1 hypothetical protein A8C56_08890 [Niabella ginsenosidivorans]